MPPSPGDVLVWREDLHLLEAAGVHELLRESAYHAGSSKIEATPGLRVLIQQRAHLHNVRHVIPGDDRSHLYNLLAPRATHCVLYVMLQKQTAPLQVYSYITAPTSASALLFNKLNT